MQYQLLSPHSEIQVSKICLGTMTYGQQNNEVDAHQQLDFALEHGVNFIDTAEMYPVPPTAKTQGLTERYIGTWLEKTGNRDKVILATKIAAPGGASVNYIRNNMGLDAINIDAAVNSSLARLKTDYIDLYQVHWPHRQANFFGQLGFEYPQNEVTTEIEETLVALHAQVLSGKIRHIGISNETPWGTMEYLRIAEKLGLSNIVSIQNPYNLLNRTYEVGMAEISYRENIGLLAYSPLAFGILSGKYLNGQRPKNARCTLFTRFVRYFNERADVATQAYVDIANDAGLDPAQMALAYVNSRPFVTSNIIGTTNLDQLKMNIESVNLSLSTDILSAIEAVHQQNPNPCP